MKYFSSIFFSATLILALCFTNKAKAQCGIPTGFLISNITTSTADFTWNAVAGATGYEGVISSSSFPPFSGTPLTTNAGSANSLSPGTLYYVHVRAICNGFPSPWLTSSFTTLGGSSPCQRPNNLTVYGVTHNTAHFSWDPISGVTGYEAAVSTDPTPPFSATMYATSNLVANGFLLPSTIQYIHVRTVCGGWYSAWVTQVFTTTSSGYSCNLASGLTATNITGSTADLSWQATPGAKGYEYVVTNNTTAPAGHGTLTTATAYNATGLTPNTNYNLHVRTHCGGAEFSNWVYIPFQTGASCAAPGGFAVNSVTSSTADVSWNAVSGAAGYEYAYTTTSTPPASGNPTSALAVTLNGLNAGSTYYAHVRTSCNGTDFSNWTTKTLFTQFPSSVSTVNNSNSITVYPNPVTDVLTVKTEGQRTGRAIITITDITGKTVHQKEVSENVSRIDINNLKPGMYTLKYTDDVRTQTIPVVKQ